MRECPRLERRDAVLAVDRDAPSSSSSSASALCSGGVPEGIRKPVRYQFEGRSQPGKRSSARVCPAPGGELQGLDEARAHLEGGGRSRGVHFLEIGICDTCGSRFYSADILHTVHELASGVKQPERMVEVPVGHVA